MIQYWKEFVMFALAVALCLSTWQCDRNRSRLNNIDASTARLGNISSAQAGRGEVKNRESILYPSLDLDNREIKQKRELIRKTITKMPTRENIQDEIEQAEQGDINRLADMFRAAGYPCSVASR